MYFCAMKIMRYLLMTAILVVSFGCNKPVNPQTPKIVGSWELIDIQYTKSAQIGDQTVEVTITFGADGSFQMSQMLGQGRHTEYFGNWTLDGDVLSGNYSDGKTWGSSYIVAVEETSMSMTPVGESAPETYIYSRK